MPELTADSKVIWNVATIEFECDVLHGVKDGSNGSTDLHQDGDLLVESIRLIVNTKFETGQRIGGRTLEEVSGRYIWAVFISSVILAVDSYIGEINTGICHSAIILFI
jgi:hypothetical protein